MKTKIAFFSSLCLFGSSFAQIATDGFPSLITPPPCGNYTDPASVYNKTVKNGTNTVKYGMTWIGDTYCGGTRDDVTEGINDMFVQADGKCLLW